MAKKHGPNKDNLAATRRIFLSIARKEFSEKGYYDASTADIVTASQMARGSLYYHFGDKRGLFRAAYEELMQEMQAALVKRITGITDPYEALTAGCLEILDLCTERTTRRIVVDVHTAITYGERIEILSRTLILEVQKLLTLCVAAGHFKGHDIRPLSIVIFGMISEGARSFELAQDITSARRDVGNAFVLLMERARG